MLKKELLLALFTLLLLVLSQTAFAECTINGKEVPCDQFWSEVGWIFIGFFIFLGLGFAFWIWMMVDCARKDFKDKALWILILLLANLVGAIIYYFVIKRKDKKKK